MSWNMRIILVVVLLSGALWFLLRGRSPPGGGTDGHPGPATKPSMQGRAVEDDPRRDCQAYAHGLLTILAQGDRRSVIIDTDQPLPKLSEIATHGEDVDWSATLPFRYERLSAEWIIGWLLGLARYPSMDDAVIHTTLHAKLTATPANIVLPKAEVTNMPDVSFNLTVTGPPGHRKLEIERQ